jgi:hypothetical protein
MRGGRSEGPRPKRDSELRGLRGTAIVIVSSTGDHMFTLEYHFGSGQPEGH